MGEENMFVREFSAGIQSPEQEIGWMWEILDS